MELQKRGVKKAKNAVTGMLPIYAYSLLIPTCAPELIVSSNTIRAVQQLKTDNFLENNPPESIWNVKSPLCTKFGDYK